MLAGRPLLRCVNVERSQTVSCLLQVVEGDTPLPLGATYRRKRLRSAGEDDDEARSTASWPNPEGSLSAGELGRYCEPEGEELQRLCQRCHIVTSQLNRQATALANSSALKVSNSTRGSTNGSRVRPHSETAHFNVGLRTGIN